jgi:hypothetical protein
LPQHKARDLYPTRTGLHLGDTHQKQRQPADEHMGTDDAGFNIRALIESWLRMLAGLV